MHVYLLITMVLKIIMENKNCKSCADRAHDSFVESIADEIRTENWQKIGKKYWKPIGVLLCVMVAGAGGYNSWNNNKRAEKDAISSQFFAAQSMIMSGDFEKGVTNLKHLIGVRNEDYAALSKLEYAAVLCNQKDNEALAVYRSVFSNEKSNVLLRDLAYVFYVNAALDMMSDEEIGVNIDEFINQLSGEYSNSVWKILAKESLAFCYIKMGRNDLAKSELESLIKMQKVPNAIAERSKIVLLAIA